MGGAFVGVADDASAVYWNPAGLAGGAYFSLLTRRQHRPTAVAGRRAERRPALGMAARADDARAGPCPITACGPPGSRRQVPERHRTPLRARLTGHPSRRRHAGPIARPRYCRGATVKLIRGVAAPVSSRDPPRICSTNRGHRPHRQPPRSRRRHHGDRLVGQGRPDRPERYRAVVRDGRRPRARARTAGRAAAPRSCCCRRGNWRQTSTSRRPRGPLGEVREVALGHRGASTAPADGRARRPAQHGRRPRTDPGVSGGAASRCSARPLRRPGHGGLGRRVPRLGRGGRILF